MKPTLTNQDIDAGVRDKISKQNYQKNSIEGVVIQKLSTHRSEDGSFSELARLSDMGVVAGFPDFHIAQINRAIMLPSTIKAWHLHFNQDEIWDVSARAHVFLGLWDVREHSSTKGVVMRIPLTSEKLVYIPRGVAHGAANHMTHAAEIFYFVSTQYNRENPDEYRLPWDSQGKEFWEVKKE